MVDECFKVQSDAKSFNLRLHETMKYSILNLIIGQSLGVRDADGVTGE